MISSACSISSGLGFVNVKTKFGKLDGNEEDTWFPLILNSGRGNVRTQT